MSPLRASQVGEFEFRYDTPIDEFVLSVIGMTKATGIHRSVGERNVEILLCTEGSGTLADLGAERSIELTSGSAVLVPAAASEYVVEGDVKLFKASAGPE